MVGLDRLSSLLSSLLQSYARRPKPTAKRQILPPHNLVDTRNMPCQHEPVFGPDRIDPWGRPARRHQARKAREEEIKPSFSMHSLDILPAQVGPDESCLSPPLCGLAPEPRPKHLPRTTRERRVISVSLE